MVSPFQSFGRVAATIVFGLIAGRIQSTAADESVSYYGKIKPLLAGHCHKCHGSGTQKAGLRLDSLKAALAGGKSGSPAIIPGKSRESELIRRIMSQDPDEQMPPKGKGSKLTEKEIELIKRWVDEGAKWPERDDYWAFLPPTDPPLPETRKPALNLIDRFIDSRLEAAKVAPVAPADARILLRRAFADLLGVPPSPEEAELFLQDRSPDAYEKLVDRLLADSRYGERWARHWLDLVRYGESDGYEDDKIRPHTWRYRDYVIRSFNADKPYDRFVQEQIAGDELWPNDSDAWIATGFARLGAWDGMSKEPAKQRQDFLNDATDAVGAVFLGVTLGCAKCHDHKYDAITQKDYYSLQAFFSSIKRESHDLKGDRLEPPTVRQTYQRDSSQITELKRERDGMFQKAREKLENEQPQPEKDAKRKLEEAAVKKKVEELFPGRLAELNAKLKPLEDRQRLNAPKAEIVFGEGKQQQKAHVLLGGEVNRPGEEVEAGFIKAMIPTENLGPQRETHRTDLARWLTSADHPLTARVMVNRLWQHHFGVGIVATPSDFGRNGRPPTHPELLDWLARDFVKEGYSIKKMHRLMMTSAAYQRSSAFSAEASAQDPENTLLWRMNRRRLEGEAIRDSILAVSGILDSTMSGPGVYAKLPKNVTVELPNNDKELSWGTPVGTDNYRRSIYLFQRRSLTFPLMDVFDAAPMSQSCSARAQTTVAPQALALFNGEFTREAAADFAERLRTEAGDDPNRQIKRAFELAFTRSPTDIEERSALSFLHDQALKRVSDGVDSESKALVDFCHVLLNANEFIYPD